MTDKTFLENGMLLIKRVIYKTTCKYSRTIAPLCGERVIYYIQKNDVTLYQYESDLNATNKMLFSRHPPHPIIPPFSSVFAVTN